MYINFKFLLSVLSAVLLLSLVMSVFSFEPSGGVLVLDGDDDYAILPLAKHGYIFPKNTDEFTVEVWFYPKSRPELGEKDTILSQQIAFGLLTDDKCRGGIGKKNEVCSYGLAHLVSGQLRGVTGINAVIKKDQWNYMAVIFRDSTFHLVYNDQIVQKKRGFMNAVAPEIIILEQFKDFFVGGYAEDKVIINRHGQVLARETYFHGEIDAIRFSNIARHDLPAKPGVSPFDPPHRFFTDAHTLALWDFNEKEGADRFEDTSGNGKMLIGMNGATTIGGTGVNLNRNPEGEVETRQDEDELEIRPDNSLATTWGQIKSSSF